MVTKDYSKSRMRENRTYGSGRGGQSNLIPSTRLTRLRREGCGRRPSKRRGTSLYKTFTTALADDRKAAPFGGWSHHLSPASGGTTTRDLLCATYEIIASRSFIVPPLQRGEGGAVGTKGGGSHRRWLITVRQFLMMNLKVSAEMQPSRRLVFITVWLKCKEYRDSSLRSE